MKNLLKIHAVILALMTFMFLYSGVILPITASPTPLPSSPPIQIVTGLPTITLSSILTFGIRVFFIIAGLAALFYMLIGAFSWITSGGDEEAVTGAKNKIQAAVIGVLMIFIVLAIIWTLEQVIFRQQICLGLSCPITIPSLFGEGATVTPAPTSTL
jgi:hypothetical protein